MSFSGPIEDRLAIRELLEAYADAVTRYDPEAWGACWAEDSAWSLPELPQIGTVKGRAAIVGLWTQAMKGFPGLVFQAWPGSIEVSGAHAKVRSYTSETFDQDGKTNRVLGRYEDVCVKTDGQWLFSARTFNVLHRQA